MIPPTDRPPTAQCRLDFRCAFLQLGRCSGSVALGCGITITVTFTISPHPIECAREIVAGTFVIPRGWSHERVSNVAAFHWMAVTFPLFTHFSWTCSCPIQSSALPASCDSLKCIITFRIQMTSVTILLLLLQSAEQHLFNNCDGVEKTHNTVMVVVTSALRQMISHFVELY